MNLFSQFKYIFVLTLLMLLVVSCQTQDSTVQVEPPPVVIGETASSQDVVEEPADAAVEEEATTQEQENTNELSQTNGITSTGQVYLPTTLNNYPVLPPPAPDIFGTQMSRAPTNDPALLKKVTHAANQAGFSWVRNEGIKWYEIEEVQGVRNWQDSFGEMLIELNVKDLTPMIIVQGTPEWAQKVPGSFCGPVKEDALDDFADFMREAVTRYSVAPYHVKYWEIGNEIDTDPSWVEPFSVFGCWGDVTDSEYFGGGYYAQMLKLVYPAIKEADPEAQVMLGGLLLDCDPTNPPANQGDGCLPAKFLEGVLANGGGDYFDILPYHAYMYWGPVELDWDVLLPKWAHRGGALLGKLDYLKEVMGRYNVSKPIIMNEGGLLCHPSSAATCNELDKDYRNDQANYAIRMYSRSGANDLIGSVWYTLDYPGWRDGALLDANQAARDPFRAIDFLSSKLKGATYVRTLTNEGVEGYEYAKGNMTYQIYWMNDEIDGTVEIPAGAKAYDKFGGDATPSGSSLTIEFEPKIVEFSN